MQFPSLKISDPEKKKDDPNDPISFAPNLPKITQPCQPVLHLRDLLRAPSSARGRISSVGATDGHRGGSINGGTPQMVGL